MRSMLNFIAGTIVGLLCFWAGWEYAHQTIATQCKRLGGFFVGPTTFKCHSIEEPGHKPPPPTATAPCLIDMPACYTHPHDFSAVAAAIPADRLQAVRNLLYRLGQEGASLNEARPQLQRALGAAQQAQPEPAS